MEDRQAWRTLAAQVLDHLEEGVHVVDAQGRTVFYNAKMAAMEQMRPEDVLGRPIQEVFRFQEAGGSTLLEAVREGRVTRNVRQTYFNSHGTRITTINHTYPLRLGDHIVGAVEIARDVTRVERLQEHLAAGTGARYTFDAIVHASAAMDEVVEQARRAARTDSSILIVGETGTGKELLAQSIHQASPRAAGPFVAQNCAALPEALMEGILFGTAKGAFTGAIDRPGLFEQAHGGTLLLDELNAMSPALQAKLLRVLQERTVRRLGDTKERRVDVRIVATMNDDPLAALSAGHLRRDLFYRLSVVTLVLPPLRERMEDVPVLVRTFIGKYNRLFGLHVQGVTPHLMRAFLRYHWPGNVRELEHTVEGAMNLVQGEEWLQTHHLPLYLRRRFEAEADAPEGSGGSVAQAQAQGAAQDAAKDASGRLRDRLAGYERAVLADVLARHGGNISAAARELGTTRQNLQYHLRKVGLRPRR
jgi:arginine utilization regulatory protein